LTLPAREFARLALEQAVDAEERRRFIDAPVDLGLRDLARAQAERQIVVNAHVG